jgi:hypothetical protein
VSAVLFIFVDALRASEHEQYSRHVGCVNWLRETIRDAFELHLKPVTIYVWAFAAMRAHAMPSMVMGSCVPICGVVEPPLYLPQTHFYDIDA